MKDPASRVAHPERLRDDGRDEARIGDRSERDEGDAIGEVSGQVGGNLQGEARLTDPTGAGQGDEPHAVATQEGADAFDVPLPAHEAGERQRRRGAMERGGSGNRRGGDPAAGAAGRGRVRSRAWKLAKAGRAMR